MYYKGLTLAESLAGWDSGAERRSDPLLTCSFSMAVFKASWTSTGTVSMVESGRNTCNLQSPWSGCTHKTPRSISQRPGSAGWGTPQYSESPNCTKLYLHSARYVAAPAEELLFAARGFCTAVSEQPAAASYLLVPFPLETWQTSRKQPEINSQVYRLVFLLCLVWSVIHHRANKIRESTLCYLWVGNPAVGLHQAATTACLLIPK